MMSIIVMHVGPQINRENFDMGNTFSLPRQQPFGCQNTDIALESVWGVPNR